MWKLNITIIEIIVTMIVIMVMIMIIIVITSGWPSHHLHMDTMEINMSTMDLKAIILVAKRRRPKAQKQASNEKWRGAFFSRPALPLCLFCSFK